MTLKCTRDDKVGEALARGEGSTLTSKDMKHCVACGSQRLEPAACRTSMLEEHGTATGNCKPKAGNGEP